ncbi:MAG: HlyD family secretion protein [bacterium]
MKKRFLLFFILIVLCAIILILSLNPRRKNMIYGSGIIEINQLTIASKISGNIKAIFVNEGDEVNIGDTLVIIEHKELLAQKQEANTGILAAEQTLKEIEIKEKDLLINLERMRNLHKSGDISDKELENFESQYDILIVQKGRAKAQIEGAKARMNLINTQLDNTCILSPLNGIVLARYYEPAEFVISGSPILKIGDLKTAYLKIYLSEKDLGRVHLHQRAEIYVDAYPKQVFSGEVTYISPEAEFTPKNIQTRDERAGLVFAIKITIPTPDTKLFPGMTADARIIEE